MLTWRVTAQNQTSRRSPAGGFEPAVEVFFQTSDGVTASVVVPKATYSAETVKAAIDDYVRHIGDVGNLSG